MPNLTKQDLVDLLVFQMGAVPWKASTTSVGTTTSVISTELADFGAAFFVGQYLLITSGVESVKWRLCTVYTTATGNFTIRPALAAAPGNAVTFEVHAYNPALYTLAINEALRSVFPALFYPLRNWGGLIAYGNQQEYPVPREFVKVVRVQRELGSSRKYWDTFNRANSTTSAGTPDSSSLAYTAQTGTWGISSNELYSETDADADRITVDLDYDSDKDVIDGLFQATVRGTLSSATIYRTPALLFRYLDASNYLLVRLLNGVVDLIKRDAGTETSLATGTVTTTNGVDYVVRVQYIGSRIAVWVDEVELIQYQLLGTDYVKFMGGPLQSEIPGTAHDKIGFRLDKAGAPGTAARIDDAKYHRWTAGAPMDFELSADNRFIQLRAGLLTDSLLIVEGQRYLTMLTADTTVGTLSSYTSARVELTLDTKELDLVMSYAKYHMYTRLMNPVVTRRKEERDEFRDLAEQGLNEANAARSLARMPQLASPIKGS